ncbi:MAG: hypothetical protein KGI52_15185, partial [Burkholderiales bacterium]|nr:hypothetical protein [Burkholderiales bacterium]
DPTLGLFLSPDPTVQAPYYTASHHRYSYAFNNPLKYTDPSGLTALYVEQLDSQSNPLSGFGGLGGLNGWAGFADSDRPKSWDEERQAEWLRDSICYHFKQCNGRGALAEVGDSGSAGGGSQVARKEEVLTVARLCSDSPGCMAKREEERLAREAEERIFGVGLAFAKDFG